MNEKMNKERQVLAELKNLGVIDRNLSDANEMSADIGSSKSSHDDPWFLQVFFGFSGVLASLFFIGFLSLILWETNVFDSTLGTFVIGLLLSVAGLGLFKNKHMRRHSFWASLAFAISAAGQLYLIFAWLDADIDQPLSVWLFLLFQSAVTIMMTNFVYRLLSSMAALGSMVYLLNYYQLTEVSLALLALITVGANLQRYTLLRYAPSKWRLSAFEVSKALMYASALTLIIFSVYVVAGESRSFLVNSDEAFHYNYLVAQGLLVATSLYAVYLILKRYDVKLWSKHGVIAVCATIVLGITSIYVSGLLATSLLIMIAIANSQRTLLGLSVFALVCYVFWYYYQLDTSLLVKSGSMLIIGIVLLLLRWLVIKRYFMDNLTAPVADDLTSHTKPPSSVTNSQERQP